MRRVTYPALLYLALLLLLLLPGAAQAGWDADDPAYQLGRELRCPVCQGMPVAESPSPMAQDMMAQVRRMLQEGKTPEQIKAFYVERYGEWVLLRPAPAGLNWLVWLGPPGLGLLLGILSFVALRRRLPTPAGGPVTAPAAAPDAFLQAVQAAAQGGTDAQR